VAAILSVTFLLSQNAHSASIEEIFEKDENAFVVLALEQKKKRSLKRSFRYKSIGYLAEAIPQARTCAIEMAISNDNILYYNNYLQNKIVTVFLL
jgi:hypothetical protein